MNVRIRDIVADRQRVRLERFFGTPKPEPEPDGTDDGDDDAA